MESIRKQFGKVLFGKYSDWVSGFFYLLLASITGGIVRLVLGSLGWSGCWLHHIGACAWSSCVVAEVSS